MTVADLRRVLAQCKGHSEVLVRLDVEALENPQGLVFEILGHDYSYGCTESLALMLECGQPSAAPAEPPSKHPTPPGSLETDLIECGLTLYCGACRTQMTREAFDKEGMCPICGNGTVQEIAPAAEPSAPESTMEHIARDIREGRFPQQSPTQEAANGGTECE
jgi:hypothetical protein